MRILLASAVYRDYPPVLRANIAQRFQEVIGADRNHEFGMWLDWRTLPAMKEVSPWTRICRVADLALEAVELLNWDYVLWCDADVVRFPSDICTRLLSVNEGITAPLPLVEGSDRLYDTAASIMQACDHIQPSTPGRMLGRNLQHEPPYWLIPPKTRFVEMACVGMCLLVPAWIFARAGCADHPAFTGWYEACRLAREHGVKVGIDRETVAHHADLPKYGMKWH